MDPSLVDELNMPIKMFWLGDTPPEGADVIPATVHYVINDFYSFNNQIKYEYLNLMWQFRGQMYVPVELINPIADLIDCTYDSDISYIEITEQAGPNDMKYSIRNVLDYAFTGNQYVRNLHISNYGTIGKLAFSGMTTLENVRISETVTSIGDSAFSDDTLIENLEVPNSVTNVGRRAFSGCELKNVILGDGLKTIGEGAFADCRDIESICSWSIVPPVCNGEVFHDVVTNQCKLYVLKQSVIAYKSEPQWENFLNIESVELNEISRIHDKDSSVSEYIYNLSGAHINQKKSRVASLVPGIYIIGGKKRLIIR